LTRYEVFGAPPGVLTPAQDRPLRVLALLSSPSGLAPLNLDVERHNILKAFENWAGVDLKFGSGTLQELLDLLTPGADVFHFAGHGGFDDRGRTAEGYLSFVGLDHSEMRFGAENLAINLAGRGVQVAFLGACEAARRGGHNPWSGIAPALTQA